MCTAVHRGASACWLATCASQLWQGRQKWGGEGEGVRQLVVRYHGD